METSINLILHNIIFIFSICFTFFIAIFVYLKDPKPLPNRMLIWLMLAVNVFNISHVIGVNVADPELSRKILMFNVSILFVSLFSAHTTFAVLGREKSQRGALWVMYTISFALFLIFIILPDTFLSQSLPKLYFPNYYAPGDLHWLMRLVSNILIPIYFFSILLYGYFTEKDPPTKKRYGFFAIGMSLAWITGTIPVLLVFNIPVDPLWGSPYMVIFGLTFTYAVLKYDLMGIKILTKKAFTYSFFVVIVGSLIAVFNFFSRFIENNYPSFPYWLIPLTTAGLIVLGGYLIWRKIREGDLLKHEFITIATHKFRTPLTHIKWAAEGLEKAKNEEERNSQISHIINANSKLVELTNILMNISSTETDIYRYHTEPTDIQKLINEVIDAVSLQANAKKIKIEKKLTSELKADCDSSKIRFVLQTLLENAINYTPEGGLITVSAYPQNKFVVCAVSDTGIGIAKSELPLVATKFYRGDSARRTDTEGLGIGLFTSQKIIEKHNGEMRVESEGIGKGSTFSFTLPLAKL